MSGVRSLNALLRHAGIELPRDVSINGLSDDSRHIQPGELFVAVPGERSDGREYIDNAIENGAVGVIVEQSEQWSEYSEYRGVPVVVLADLGRKAGELAAAFYAEPSSKLKVIGITGTNAKTSCSSYIHQLLRLLGTPCGVIGTLGWGAAEHLIATGNTTPGNLLLQKILAEFVERDISHVALEVSSHGLELGRVKGVQFTAALFTNISHDHLDFHGSMQNYVAAKKKLFASEGLQLAVLNCDDEYAPQMRAAAAAGTRIIQYGFSAAADLRISELRSSLDGLQARLSYAGRDDYQLNSKLLGDFNIYNLAAAIAVLLGLDYPLEDILAVVPQVIAVKGRMETVSDAQHNDITVLVDYAHTPDGLEKVLQSLSALCAEQQLWCVFGCGGDRDKEKRPLMGAAAAQYADRVIITSDNPRSESPQQIIDEIAAQCRGAHVAQQIDRQQAIHQAVSSAARGDCVLVAGKGHENYQEIQGKKIPFSDHLVIHEALNMRAGCAS